MTYRPVDVVEVLAWGRRVGAVALDPATEFYVFEYASAWQAGGVELAPTTMPLRTRAHVFPSLPARTFYRLPAMLADALPDNFGSALTTAYLVDQGVAPAAITPLDRLAYLGGRGTGALGFRPVRGPRTRTSTAVELSELVRAARDAVAGTFGDEGGISAAVRHLIAVGTSAGGARPKAVIAWNPTTSEVRSGQVPADPGFEQWLVKLDGVGADLDLGESADFGRIEFAYSLMAKAAGIEMSACRLLPEGGRSHFMTRRFDRTPEGAKVHLQTLCALGQLDFRLTGAHGYAQAFEMLGRLGLGEGARSELFRRMVFNVAAANCDDHTKNLSFLLAEGGRWALSPAYDMTHAHHPLSPWTARHLMAVNGVPTGISRRDVAVVGDRFVVPRATPIVAEVLAAVDSWSEFADAAGVGTAAKDEVGSDINAMSAPLR
ncbi:MAG: type II toxin-antitoxin system HipA family toxin [Actinomycetota bacterium]